MSSNKSHKLQFGPQSQSRKPGSSHKGSNLQKWNVIDMRNALVFYFSVRAPGYTGRKYGYKAVADAYTVPRAPVPDEESGKQIYLPLVFHFLFITCKHFE